MRAYLRELASLVAVGVFFAGFMAGAVSWTERHRLERAVLMVESR
ncbi:hypothetical protein [Aureimonas sp. ME7]|nr:hypothetical protein [Aureimonas sp. ME7]